MKALALALLMGIACTSTVPAPSPSTRTDGVPPARTSVATRATATIPFASGLVIDIPSSWQRASEAPINRATYRLASFGNGDLTSLATAAGNGDIDVAKLPAGRVVVALQVFCRLACAGPSDETHLPLDWRSAAPLSTQALPTGKSELAVSFRWFDQPIFFVARWSNDAPQADIAAIEAAARSVRPEPPPPSSGEYRGWAGIGPLANIAVGTVRLQPLPPGATPPVQAYDNAPYFVVRGKQHVFTFVSRPLVDARCEIQYDAAADRFVCAIEGRRYEWTRFGRYLGPEPRSDLPQHRVIVRDGLVWVLYGVSSLNSPPVQDEDAER